MAEPVQQIFAEQSVSLPADYTLPPGLDMEFASVRAKVNGAVASADFIVVLEALSQNGKIMAQSRIDQELAVGDTGALTWAPFLRRTAAATPSGGFGEWAYMLRSTDLVVLDNSFPVLTSYNFGAQSGSFYTIDTTAGTIKPTAAGVFVIGGQLDWTTTYAGGQFLRFDYDVDDVDFPGFRQDFWSDHSSATNSATSVVRLADPGDATFPGLTMVVGQTSGLSRTITNAWLSITRIG